MSSASSPVRAPPSPRSTTSVDVTAAGVASPAVTVGVGASVPRVVATAVATPEGLRTLAFGARETDTEGADFGNTHRFVLGGAASGTLRTEQRLFDVDELVVASGGGRLVAAYVGALLECYGNPCHGSDRTGGWNMVFRPRERLTAGVVALNEGGIFDTTFDQVWCEGIGGDVPVRVTPYWVNFGDQPADRCRMVRRRRPQDVALAVHGAHAFAAYRRAGTVEGVTLTEDGDPVEEQWHESEREGERYEARQAREERERAAVEARASARRVLATGDVGAPTVAWRGDAAVVVWPQRANARAPYSLRYVEWSHPDTAPRPAPRTLATGAASASAPALVAVGDRLVLAWADGDDRRAAVHVASTALAAEHLADHAVVVSAPTVNARDPELAVAGDRAWVAWSEYPAGRRRDQGDGRVRLSPLRFP